MVVVVKAQTPWSFQFYSIFMKHSILAKATLEDKDKEVSIIQWTTQVDSITCFGSQHKTKLSGLTYIYTIFVSQIR